MSTARILLLHRLMRLTLGAFSWLLVSACSEPSQGPLEHGVAGAGSAGTPEVPALSVELGVPGGQDGLEFLPIADGAELRLQTFGQGGTHVMIAVRSNGFGKRAFVSARLRNLASGAEVEEPPPARPQLLYCTDELTCDLVPYLVHASGLTETDAEKDGLRVELTAEVRTEAGASAQGSCEVVLSTADL